ncbi:hypothetical protein OSTOST_20000 [Ostertagia ostertagi]
MLLSIPQSGRFYDAASSMNAAPCIVYQLAGPQGVTNLPYVLNFPTLPPPAREDCAITAMAQDLRQKSDRVTETTAHK